MWRPNIRNRAFDRMGERYGHLIDPYHFLGRSSFDIPYSHQPPVNVKQEGALLILEVAVPGFKKEEISITVESDVLTIRGSKEERTSEKTDKFIVEEFGMESFHRKFKLASGIGHEKITATYEDGVLKLVFVDVPPDQEKESQEVNIS